MDLTLIIPAKEEEFSLPLVLEEIKGFPAKKLIILSKKGRRKSKIKIEIAHIKIITINKVNLSLIFFIKFPH